MLSLILGSYYTSLRPDTKNQALQLAQNYHKSPWGLLGLSTGWSDSNPKHCQIPKAQIPGKACGLKPHKEIQKTFSFLDLKQSKIHRPLLLYYFQEFDNLIAQFIPSLNIRIFFDTPPWLHHLQEAIGKIRRRTWLPLQSKGIPNQPFWLPCMHSAPPLCLDCLPAQLLSKTQGNIIGSGSNTSFRSSMLSKFMCDSLKEWDHIFKKPDLPQYLPTKTIELCLCNITPHLNSSPRSLSHHLERLHKPKPMVKTSPHNDWFNRTLILEVQSVWTHFFQGWNIHSLCGMIKQSNNLPSEMWFSSLNSSETKIKDTGVQFLINFKLPICIVDSAKWRGRFKMVNPEILPILWKRIFITEWIIQKTHHTCRSITSHSELIPFICLTGAAWLSLLHNLMLVFAALWINKDFKVVSVILSLQTINGTHTGTILAPALKTSYHHIILPTTSPSSLLITCPTIQQWDNTQIKHTSIQHLRRASWLYGTCDQSCCWEGYLRQFSFYLSIVYQLKAHNIPLEFDRIGKTMTVETSRRPSN